MASIDAADHSWCAIEDKSCLKKRKNSVVDNGAISISNEQWDFCVYIQASLNY